jgi:hypothetical protein
MSNKIRIRSHISSDSKRAVVIRLAESSDSDALERLAGRDTAPVPAQPVLVAEVEGELRVARSIADGRTIADPFHRTAELVDLLAARAGQVRDAARKPLRVIARTASPRVAGEVRYRGRAAA